MTNDRNTRIAQALEPEPGPTRASAKSMHLFSPLGMWTNYWGENPNGEWRPQEFDADETAWKLAWARLTEEQMYEVFAEMRAGVLVATGWQLMTWANSTLAERCDWMLAVLEGK